MAVGWASVRDHAKIGPCLPVGDSGSVVLTYRPLEVIGRPVVRGRRLPLWHWLGWHVTSPQARDIPPALLASFDKKRCVTWASRAPYQRDKRQCESNPDINSRVWHTSCLSGDGCHLNRANMTPSLPSRKLGGLQVDEDVMPQSSMFCGQPRQGPFVDDRQE
ncbi:hypothetical protein Bbelb_015070 [Branchiostoma belcheri]|nr:hypothetical protein Bbelb_015070 [Branchiostoma belcheri]